MFRMRSGTRSDPESVLRISRDRLFLETYTQPIRDTYPTLSGISHLSHFGPQKLKSRGCRVAVHTVTRARGGPAEATAARSAHCRKAESNKVEEVAFSGLLRWMLGCHTASHQRPTTAKDE